MGVCFGQMIEIETKIHFDLVPIFRKKKKTLQQIKQKKKNIFFKKRIQRRCVFQPHNRRKRRSVQQEHKQHRFIIQNPKYSDSHTSQIPKSSYKKTNSQTSVNPPSPTPLQNSDLFIHHISPNHHSKTPIKNIGV